MRLYLFFSSASFQVTNCPSFHGTVPIARHEVQGPLLCCPIFLALVQNPRSHPGWGVDLKRKSFAGILKGLDTSSIVDLQRRETPEPFFSWTCFTSHQWQPIQNLNLTWHWAHFSLETACVIVPVVALGVHHEHLKWLLLQLQMTVPAPHKEGHWGFCS